MRRSSACRMRRNTSCLLYTSCITEALVDTLRMLKKSNIPFVVTDYDPNLAEPTVGLSLIHISDAPAACTKTEGCTLAEGHEGACVLPEEGGESDAPAVCTKTEGCTLAEGHEGECVLPKENGEPVVTMLDGVNLSLIHI